MRDGRSKHPREEEHQLTWRGRAFTRSGGTTIERAENDVLVSLATITLWKVRVACVCVKPFGRCDVYLFAFLSFPDHVG